MAGFDTNLNYGHGSNFGGFALQKIRGMTIKDKARKRALFLHCAGQKVPRHFWHPRRHRWGFRNCRWETHGIFWTKKTPPIQHIPVSAANSRERGVIRCLRYSPETSSGSMRFSDGLAGCWYWAAVNRERKIEAGQTGRHLFPSAKLTFSSPWLSQDIPLFLHKISLSLEIPVHKSLSLFNF